MAEEPSSTAFMDEATRRCIVIDGQPVLRSGVRGLLADRYEVEEVPDGEGALQMLTSVGDFDVAVVDMGTRSDRHLSGMATIRALLEAQPGLGIVAHATRAEGRIASEALDAGATAFVAKDSPANELKRAVDAAADDEEFVDPAAEPTLRRGRTLTRRQREILQHYADGDSTDSTARLLGLSPETVRTHTKAILARLDAHDRAHAVAIALRGALIE
ncbi:MAG: LuxR C-terminal-related transcriptional regulator [Solirubrobacterales bacterium]